MTQASPHTGGSTPYGHGAYPYGGGGYPAARPAAPGVSCRLSSRILPLAGVAGLLCGAVAGLFVSRAIGGSGEARAESAAPVAGDEQRAAAGGDQDPDRDPTAAAVAVEETADGADEESSDEVAAAEASDDANEQEANEQEADEASLPATATLVFAVEPPDADASIAVDGEQVTGDAYGVVLEGSASTVEVTAEARGYKTFRETLEVEADREVAIELERVARREGKASRRRSGRKSGRKRRNRSRRKSGKGSGSPSGPGGMIDL